MFGRDVFGIFASAVEIRGSEAARTRGHGAECQQEVMLLSFITSFWTETIRLFTKRRDCVY